MAKKKLLTGLSVLVFLLAVAVIVLAVTNRGYSGESFALDGEGWSAEVTGDEMTLDLPSNPSTGYSWVVTEKWPPTIADLREKADSIVNGERPDWGLGWHEVQQAIQKYGYMQWEKAQESMNPITREAVRRIGWQSICESENPETIRAQFRQVYEICEKRESADRNLPPELKSMIGNLLSANSRPQLEGETP